MLNTELTPSLSLYEKNNHIKSKPLQNHEEFCKSVSFFSRKKKGQYHALFRRRWVSFYELSSTRYLNVRYRDMIRKKKDTRQEVPRGLQSWDLSKMVWNKDCFTSFVSLITVRMVGNLYLQHYVEFTLTL